MKALLIAEKPSLMRAVQGAYKKGGFKDQIDFFALHGHIMTLKNAEDYNPDWKKWKKEDLPLIPPKFAYKVNDNTTASELKKKLKENNYDYLINCCDPDREGQHIFYSIYETLGLNLPVKRMWHNDLTDQELLRALNSMEDDLNTPRLKKLKEASKLRAQMDWLIGINSTRALSLQRGSVTRIGRVMTPTLKIIVDRELAIKNFKQIKSYGVEADFSEGYRGEMWDKEPVRFDDKNKALEAIKTLPREGVITSIETKKNETKAPRLPSLGDVQTEANRRFGFSLEKTLSMVQELYEANLCSYPRTDCPYVTEEIARDFDKIIAAIKDVDEVKTFTNIDKKDIARIRKDKNYVDNSKVTAHYALIPTSQKPYSAKISDDARKVYGLICQRFIAIFLKAYTIEKTKVIAKVGDKDFYSEGNKILEKGWKELYGVDKFTELPQLKKGQKVTVKKVEHVEHESKAPSRFTDASLLQAMINAGNYVEDKDLAKVLKGDKNVKDSGGIGTPATRSAIVEKLVTTGMIVRKSKYFYASDESIKLMEEIGKLKITSPELTAIWEQKLLAIENEEKTVKEIGTELLAYTRELTNELLGMNVSKSVPGTNKLNARCPVCGEEVKAGKDYYFCSNYKKGCNFIFGKDYFGTKISEKDAENICSGKKTALKKITSKTGKKYTGKLYYDKENSKLAVSLETTEPKETKLECPYCGGKMVKKKGQYGEYLSCEGGDFQLGLDFRGKKLTETELSKLFAKGEVGPLTFKSKAGKDYQATVTLFEKKIEYKVDF